MKIDAITCRFLKLPTRRKHRWASLTVDVGSWLIVEITTDDGAYGFGEADALAQWSGEWGRYYGETPGTVHHVIENLYASALLGKSPVDIVGRLREIDATVAGHPYARTAVEMALLDLRARQLGIPVYELLGGRQRETIPMAHSIGLMAVEDAVAEARKVVDEGIRTLKIKVGENDARDAATVLGARDAVGDDIAIVVDANCAWGTAVRARRAIDALLPARLQYVEQPVSGLVEMEMLARGMPGVPLMADESAWTARDVVDIARTGAAQLVSIYTSKAGGLLNARKMDIVAQAHGLGSNLNGSSASGIGNLANVHLAASCESLSESSVFPLTGLKDNRPTAIANATYLDDVLVSPFTFEDGCVVVPDGPGWGIDVDRDKLAEFTVEERVIR